MPFKEPLNSYFRNLVAPTIESTGYVPLRADDIYSTRAIIKDIFNEIIKAKFIIADLTGRSPNVMYELGIAHALEKPVILIISDKDDLPFDLQHLRIIKYKTQDVDWQDKLIDSLKRTIRNVIDNPQISLAWVNDSKEVVLNKSISELLLRNSKDFKGYFIAKDKITVDENGSCYISHVRHQVAESDTSVIYTEYHIDKPGIIEFLGITDLDSKKQLEYSTHDKDEKSHGIFIIFDEIIRKKTSFNFEVKLFAENYMSDLVDEGQSVIDLLPFSKNRFKRLEEEYIFPGSNLFTNVRAVIVDHPNKFLVGKEILASYKGAKYILRIDYGNLDEATSKIEIRIMR